MAQRENDKTMPSWSVKLLILFFGSFLCLPGLVHFLNLEGSAGQGEQRTLAEVPSLPRTWNGLRDFPDDINAYVRDRFGLRSSMVRLFSLLNYRLGHSVDRRVILGREGWLFINQNNSINRHRGLVRVSEDEMANCARYFTHLDRFFSERDIPFILVIAPDKESIYPEYLPAWAESSGEPSSTGEFAADLRSRDDLSIVDLSDSLLATRHERRLYFKTDSHWNSLGAYVGFRQLEHTLLEIDPDLNRIEESEVSITSRSYSGDLARLLNLNDRLTEDAPYAELANDLEGDSTITWLTQPASAPTHLLNHGTTQLIESDYARNNRTLLIYRDSFSNPLRPFLASTFERLIYSHHNRGEIDLSLVDTRQPDIAILQIVERSLPNFCSANLVEWLQSEAAVHPGVIHPDNG